MAVVGRMLLVVLAFGSLIFVHELGHFLAAKWVGVRVDVFSLGFGPFLFSRKRGDTTYAVSLVPVGGYVKMTGQAEPGPKDGPLASYDWNAKPPSRRALILVCGVAMNMVFAYLLFVFVYLIGMRVTPPKVGPLNASDPAYRAGVRAGDEFVEIGGKRPITYEDVVGFFTAGAGETGAIVRRGDARIDLLLPTFGDPEKVAWTYPPPVTEWPLRIGCTGVRRVVVRESTAGKPAERAGVRAGDIILSVDSEEVFDVPALQKAVGASGGGEVEIVLVRAGAALPAIVIEPVPNDGPQGPPFVIGVRPAAPVCVERVEPGSPAERAGLRRFDIIELQSIEKLRDGRVSLSWRRGQEKLGPGIIETSPGCAAFMVPETEQILDRRGIFWRDGRPGAVFKGFSECWRTATGTLAVLTGLVTRRLVPSKTMGGFLIIGLLAYKSAEEGADLYIWRLAFLSVMIGVFNLFPIPPLDGALLAFVAFEKIRGRPVARRTRELALTMGLVLILALIVYVTWLDVGRIHRWLGG